MSSLKIIVYMIAILLFIIGIEFALIYIFDIDATILQSLKYIIPITIAISIAFAFYSARKTKPKIERTDPNAKKQM